MDRGMVIAEIAGRDSVAAVVAAVEERGFARVLPTIGLTGTEIGDRSAPLRAVAALRNLLGNDIDVLEPVELADHALWSALNATHASVLQHRFGICSPCLACHLYLHLLRVPISWARGYAPVVGGERDTHDGRLKLSQTTASIDAATRVLAYAEVELMEPVRHLDGAEISTLTGGRWDEGDGQLGCLLSGNYKDLDGCTIVDHDAYDSYVRGFFEPVGMAIVDAMRTAMPGEPVDYEAVVREVLAP